VDDSEQGDLPQIEQKFLKSLRNRRTENAGLRVLLEDARFQAPESALKQRLLDYLGVGQFGSRAFDAVMTESPSESVTSSNLDVLLPSLVIVEMKTTQKPITDERLNGFFFGATDREFQLAASIPGRHRWAFVVLNSANRFGRPFFVLLTHQQLEARIRVKRIQFQVNLAWEEDGAPPYEGIGPAMDS
jgi:hypothetical protein